MQIITADTIIEETEQHFKVIAGPGAGKTEFLVNHVRNVLNNSNRLSRNRKIACITYTNVGVDTLINRIEDEKDHLEISTIHSFLFTHVVKPYLFVISSKFDFGKKYLISETTLKTIETKIPEKVLTNLLKIKGQVYDRDKFESVLESTINKTNTSKFQKLIRENSIYVSQNFENPFEHVFSNGYFQKTQLPVGYGVSEKEMKKLSWEIYNNECVLVLKNRQKEDKILDYHNHLLKYKSFFWEKGILHYDDILAFAWEIIKTDANVLRILRAKFPYFFVDEFQDTNPIQTAILKKIAESETIVGVIGDSAQSIYSFQGAVMQQFIDFELPSINYFKIKDNWRSTNQIINVLKAIRNDLPQISPKNRNGKIPKIIVGESIQALEHSEALFGNKKVVSLSYMVPVANAMRKRISIDSPANVLIEQLMEDDKDSSRRKLLIAVVKAIEFARQQQFDEAIKKVAFQLRKTDDFKGRKNTLILIKSLLNSYDDFANGKLWDLYNKVIQFSFIDIKRIQERKNGNPTKVELVYKNTDYKDLALSIRLFKDETIHRTIHKAKGDEFENVLVVVKGKKGYKYNEKRDLAFLLEPNLIETEDHRVYYVACSRAKDNLLINVPELSDSARQKLSGIFEIIDLPLPESHAH